MSTMSISVRISDAVTVNDLHEELSNLVNNIHTGMYMSLSLPVYQCRSNGVL